MQMSKESAERRLAVLNMDDVPLVQHVPVATALPADWFTKYKQIARQFMEGLTDSVEELAMLNLPQDQFMSLLMGRGLPTNMSLRWRIPLMWGGKMETSNMFMCRTFPHSYNMDRFIIEQTGNDIIWLPNPERKVYVPVNMLGGGDGGNATEDRLSQVAAQMSAARDI